MLPRIDHDRDLLAQLKTDWRQADLDPQTRLILELAETVTLEPSRVRKVDLDRLRAEGFSDELILDVVLIAAQCNLTNRISLSLGVEPPAEAG